MGQRSLLAICAITATAHGEVTAVRGGAGVNLNVTIPTANFLYFGPRRATVQGPAVWLDGASLCNPKRETVEGKIVFSESGGEGCSFDDIYERLSRDGALALLYFGGFWDRPGMMCHAHYTWRNPNESRRQQEMTFLASKLGDIDLEAWRASSSADGRAGNLELVISAPHDHAACNFMLGVAWWACMRVIFPVLASWVAWVGFVAAWKNHSAARALENSAALSTRSASQEQGNRHRLELKRIALFVCVAEAVSCGILAIVFALGQW